MSWVHEGGVGDLLSDVLVLVEGERAAQADVRDDAHGPHVQRAVVAAAADHLGRQVGRRAHDRAAERLLADDAGEAEVAQLHLQQTQEWILTCRGDNFVLKHKTITEAHLRERVRRGQQDVLRFQVTVSDMFEVQIPQSLEDLQHREDKNMRTTSSVFLSFIYAGGHSKNISILMDAVSRLCF